MKQTVLISGATGDIGFEISKELANNYNLVLLGYNNKDRLKTLSFNAIFTKLIDITNVKEVDELFNELKNKQIKIDIYIHCVGKEYIGLLQDMDYNSWKKVLDNNLNSAFYMTKNILPNMINQKFGKMIFISSVWAKSGASMEVAYSTAKGGLDTFVKALAKELAPSNISINSVNFGMIDTKMNSHLDDIEKYAILSDIPMGRQGSPKECAIFIKNLINMPQYLTAQNINFDGGWI